VRRISYENATAETPAVSFTYDQAYGRLTRVEDSAGTIEYSYQRAGVLGALQLIAAAGPVSGARMEYQYDELGRVIRRAINGAATTMRYDTLGRLTRLDNPLGAFEIPAN
jgi:hypothetical protein